MLKVKVILSTSAYCYECEGQNSLYPVSKDWEEVTDAEYVKIAEAVSEANRVKKFTDETYVLISYDDTTLEKMFAKASDFRKSVEERKLKDEKKKKEAADKRKVTKLERKRKQLEKLKKELNET